MEAIDVAGRGRPTLREVAQMAGVSSATVSRVLNGGRWVAPATREAVQNAVRDTGYTMNRMARSLATGRANSVAFLLTEAHHLLFSDPTFSILLRGAAESLSRRDMTLVLLVAGTDAERANVLRYVSSGHLDGVLLISSHESDPLLESLGAANIPTVCCGVPLGHDIEVPSVAIDERGAAIEMTRHLQREGHRRIAMIAGPRDTSGGRFRLEGFKEAMGDDFDADLVVEGDYGRPSGLAGAEELLRRGKPFDAVFAASDSMAAGALQALRRAGLSVPRDIAVAGFDDSGLAEETDPPLTTMRQPWDELSEAMVTLLLRRLEGEAVDSVVIPATLVQRLSA